MFSNSVLTLEVLPRKPLVDHDDRHRFVVVAHGEGASGEHRDAHGLKEIRRNNAHMPRLAIAASRGMAFNLE